MRSGPDQRSRGRLPGNRPSQQQHQGTSQRSQTFDSHGPAERVRGSAFQIYDRYLALARDAARGEDRVASEKYYQYAEHYFRVNNAGRDGNATVASPSIDPAPVETGIAPAGPSELEADRDQRRTDDNQPGL